MQPAEEEALTQTTPSVGRMLEVYQPWSQVFQEDLEDLHKQRLPDLKSLKKTPLQVGR